MDRLHQLFRNIKTIISEINDGNRGRPKNISRGCPFTDKIAIQTILIVLLANIEGWNISQTQRNLYIALIDMSDLPVPLYDTLANWGVCGKGSFYGYKLHLMTTRDGIPLGFVVWQEDV